MAKKTLARKLRVSKDRLSEKIAKVKRDHPEKTPRQAAGMAAGILRSRRKRASDYL